jgi:hypothetical protein
VVYGSAEEISVDTAAMGAEIGGGGANINIIPKSAATRSRDAVQHHRPRILGWLHRQHHARAACSGHPGSDAAEAERLQCERRRPLIRDRLWWFGSFRNYSTVEATRATTVNADGSLTNPFDSNLRNYTASTRYQMTKSSKLSDSGRSTEPSRTGTQASRSPVR